MAPHHAFLAVFGADVARAPTPLSPSCKSHVRRLPEELEQQETSCRSALDRAYSASNITSRRLEMLGHGSGFSLESSPYCRYATKNGVHVLFAGEVSEWPGINVVSAAHDAFLRGETASGEDDAHFLLDFYETFVTPMVTPAGACADLEQDLTDRALDCLTQIRGSFAFVVYDSVQRRVLAGRDSESSQPMYWGATEDGQLMFGSTLDDLTGCNPSATAFPAGTLFASEPHALAYQTGEFGWVINDDDCAGQLLSFIKADNEHWRGVKAIPRITSKGLLCGAVYKVASQPDFGRGAQGSIY